MEHGFPQRYPRGHVSTERDGHFIRLRFAAGSMFRPHEPGAGHFAAARRAYMASAVAREAWIVSA